MHISRVELENIKSHASAQFNFNRGTTAITGENGAGKTTIIEAIAWVLFDLLEYKKEDFVKRGERRGRVTVTFESSLDEREYVVTRDTATSYFVTDPRLEIRVATKREEVFRFLWQHLGLEPGTDLRSLFRQAIGVPQGTFTAIFLEGATERKVAFDRLLKVEEYRQAAEKLRETSRYIDGCVADLRETVARAEGELLRSASVETEHTSLAARIGELTAGRDALSFQVAEQKSCVETLDAQATHVNDLRTAHDQEVTRHEKATLMLDHAVIELSRSETAAQKASAAKPEHDRHVFAMDQLRKLETERQLRDGIKNKLAEVEAGLGNAAAEHKRLNLELEAILKAHSEITALKPAADEQETLERDIVNLRNRREAKRAAAAALRDREARLIGLRELFSDIKKKRAEAESKSVAAVTIEPLKERELDLMHQLAHRRANLAHDERFRGEVKNGMCPVMSAKCLNLAEGQTLEGFLSAQSHELRSEITSLEAESARLAENLRMAADAQRFAETAVGYAARQEELRAEGLAIAEEKSALENQAEGLAEDESLLAASETRLKSLDNPSAKIRFLERQITRENEIRKDLAAGKLSVSTLESARAELTGQLENYQDLDARWSVLAGERDTTAAAYRVYLANEAESKLLDQRKTEVEAAREASEISHLAREASEGKYQNAQSGYDAGAHQAARAALSDTDNRYHATMATLETATVRVSQLVDEINRFKDLRGSIQTELREKARMTTVGEATAYIRDTLKEAAPRVARNYVHHVSGEANQMFREITGNAEQTLKWAEDYSIILEEDGYERPFISLSGGEQMSAALAVRLALLKQLSDIRIAFFDEPTTNMDETRRENFAQQIGRITNFDQLFVISHDDTFDHYVDQVIAV